MLKSDEIDRDIASGAAGSVIWLRLEAAGLVPPCTEFEIDRQKTLDLLSLCQEHGVKPEPEHVLNFLVDLLIDSMEVEEDDEVMTQRDRAMGMVLERVRALGRSK